MKANQRHPELEFRQDALLLGIYRALRWLVAEWGSGRRAGASPPELPEIPALKDSYLQDLVDYHQEERQQESRARQPAWDDE